MPAWVEELRRLLTDGDVAAQHLWEQRGDDLKDLLPVQTFGLLRRAIENFEFDAALAALANHAGPVQS
jgi:hypothetical protein